MNGNWQTVAADISRHTQTPIEIRHQQSVSGGCINQCWELTDQSQTKWFVKTNRPELSDMFIAEAQGLQEIINTQSVRAPQPVCYGKTASFSYLVLEHIPLKTLKNQALAGKQLAQMHFVSRQQNNLFGWKRDNTIGSTPQPNKQQHDWVKFWREERLLFQLKLAHSKGLPTTTFDKGLLLAERLDTFFNQSPQASLVHGDLWGGNCATDAQGNPVIFDPAVYYGDRETDLAMTELFGGFNADFYAAYQAVYPLDDGYETRKVLYNLYHILNHYNLFGGGYGSQAGSMIDQLLAQT